MKLHTFGDSHSCNGWNGLYNFNHHLGPVLCYSIGKDGLNRLNITKFNVKNNDIIVFCFGEIDCRCHVHKHISEQKSYELIIDEIVNNYFNTIAIEMGQKYLMNLQYSYNHINNIQFFNV